MAKPKSMKINGQSVKSIKINGQMWWQKDSSKFKLHASTNTISYYYGTYRPDEEWYLIVDKGELYEFLNADEVSPISDYMYYIYRGTYFYLEVEFGGPGSTKCLLNIGYDGIEPPEGARDSFTITGTDMDGNEDSVTITVVCEGSDTPSIDTPTALESRVLEINDVRIDSMYEDSNLQNYDYQVDLGDIDSSTNLTIHVSPNAQMVTNVSSFEIPNTTDISVEGIYEAHNDYDECAVILDLVPSMNNNGIINLTIYGGGIYKDINLYLIVTWNYVG